MKMLLIHAEDDPEQGPWTSLAWDRIVDLGLGGINQYARWSSQFHCPVTNLNSLRSGLDDLLRVRNLLGLGIGRLVDDYGLDWWEILSIRLTSELETLILLQRLAQTFAPDDEIHISRPGVHATLLQCLLNTRLQIFPARHGANKNRIGHYLRRASKLSAAQIADVFWDKYDAGYQLRGHWRQKRKSSTRPVVLLPTAYVNVSRTGIAYSNTFPKDDFLLVTTRRSGWVNDPPKNVTVARLSSYVSLCDRSEENTEMERKWRSLLNEFSAVAEFEILKRSGSLADFQRHFPSALEIRDAWRNVLDTEPVEAVLCADDNNPYTSIPRRLARERGIPNIACHHGALDGQYVFKRNCADLIWAKGRMEQDYLVRRCGVPGERVEIAAPILAAPKNESARLDQPTFRPFILFISEACDSSGGRPKGFYADILPAIADLAFATRRKLIVKLHPAESESDRARMVARILSRDQRSVVRVVSGPLTDDLLSKTWFGVTILSTVAMECAIREIPCFLCKWLEFSPYEYVEQFLRFGVGIALNDLGELKKIPEYLRQNGFGVGVRGNCWQPAASTRLREVIASGTSCSELAS